MAKGLSSAVIERVYRDVYICRKCNATLRSKKRDNIKCRKCGSKSLRPKRKEKKGM